MTLFVTHNFLEDMALMMCIAALATIICRLLRQPLLVGYLVDGWPGVEADTSLVADAVELRYFGCPTLGF